MSSVILSLDLFLFSPSLLTDDFFRITKKHRLTQADIKEILSYAETIDQLKFLTNETILFLQKACKRIDQMRSQIANIEALQVVQEASKSAQERAQ